MGKNVRSRKVHHNSRYEHNERAIYNAILILMGAYRGRITARQVAKSAGLTRQTIYNHHPNINQAIVNNEKALLQKFSSGLDQQIEKLSKVTTDKNGRIFYAIMIFMARHDIMIFMARHDDVFFPVCTNINNQGLLYQIVEAAYPRLEISWLPVGLPAPCAGSERVESYLHKSVGIICRWGKVTHCDVRRGGRYINSLLRATEDATRNRL